MQGNPTVSNAAQHHMGNSQCHPLKVPLSVGGGPGPPSLTHGSLNPHKLTSQGTCESIQPIYAVLTVVIHESYTNVWQP